MTRVWRVIDEKKKMDGQIYEVANTAMGDDLVMNHIAERVEVTGTVAEKREAKIITVKSFKVVLEKK